ncbi:MAG: hypothetical protein AAF334_05285, partial [Pseudomonadota bacterium]
ACLLARYKGGRKATAAEPAMSLLSPAEVERASQVGALIRLGASIAGAMPGYLGACPLSIDAAALTISPTPDGQIYVGEEVEKRLGQAARALGLDARIM